MCSYDSLPDTPFRCHFGTAGSNTDSTEDPPSTILIQWLVNQSYPGKNGSPTFNELKWIQYEPSERIYYKLDLEDQLTELPGRPLTISDVFALPHLYTSRSAIFRNKWTDLQSMKKFIPSDTHAFYDNISCEEESRGQVARKRKHTEHVINGKNKKVKTDKTDGKKKGVKGDKKSDKRRL
ncbi:hypothetical protein AVEN_81639-1 [Araneus ventricosus]|uniref:Uncharacterized protein n=1 Tax=Araneus ventricosus TaxID=182803 RepID=A0A4Y2SVY5_ARAVE|nr:hypothetical protein AVEN_81639-1 [Araneus ventricosus]